MAHILLIEDDPQFAEMLQQMLEQDYHRVTSAADGEVGVRLAGEVKPDLILTDILMPKLDGIEAILALRKQGQAAPIIAMSGGRRSITADFNLESAELMGVSATLSKPFTRAQLRDAINQALK